MKNYRQSTQEISYSYSAQTSSGRALIKILENVTGRASLITKAQNYELEVASGESFWEVMFQRYGLVFRNSGLSIKLYSQGWSIDNYCKSSFWYFRWINSWVYFVKIQKKF